jgi:hypothetical protein
MENSFRLEEEHQLFNGMAAGNNVFDDDDMDGTQL